MLIIRLQRVGRKNDPSFRVVVTDSRHSTKTGKFIEIVGSYDARQSASRRTQLNAEKIKEWIGKGAQVSETVHNLLVKNKIIEGQTINLVPEKKVVPTSAEATVGKEETLAEEPVIEPEPVTSTTADKEDTPAETKDEESKVKES
ncbi:MAG: 30S ribosomal protein S16 [Patescibacteria group bacterium]